jgi:transcriptional regulator
VENRSSLFIFWIRTVARDTSYIPLDYLEEGVVPLDNQEEWKAMRDDPTELVQGTLEMLVLKTLTLMPMHGYGIATRIEQISDGAFRVNPGSLLPALSRMERAGHVKGDWKVTENNRRGRYYTITEKGRKALKNETATWDRQTAAIYKILEA